MQRLFYSCLIICLMLCIAVSVSALQINSSDVQFVDHDKKPASTIIDLTQAYYNSVKRDSQPAAKLPDDFAIVLVTGESAKEAIAELKTTGISHNHIIMLFLDEDGNVDAGVLAFHLCRIFQGDFVDDEQAVDVAKHVVESFVKGEIFL